MLSYSKDVLETKLVPQVDWSTASASDHFVQFYESDDYLLESLSGFISTGLSAGDACIVVASEPHRSGLARRLAADGVDLGVHIAGGHYLELDAAEMLSALMAGDAPDAERFSRLIGAVVARAVKRGRHVRVFGEMVALLWAEGKHQAALRLEELWNDLQATYRFSLVCAYPIHGFDADQFAPSVEDVCVTHSHVIPAESYSALSSPDERLRAIARLQQKASALELQIAERRRATERFRFLADSMPQKVFAARSDGSIDYVNLQWREFTGLGLEEVRSAGWEVVVHPDDVEETGRGWQRSIDSGEPFQVEHRFRQADGSYRWHLSRAHAMRDGDKRTVVWIGSSTDIDDQKRREADLDRSIRLRDEFLATISHDLKTPLTVLQGQSQVLVRRLEKGAVDEARLLKGLERIEERSRMMAGLVDELLDVSQLRAGQELQLCLRPVDLVALLRQSVATEQEGSSAHRLVLRVREPELIGHWDAVRVRRVVDNLIGNAVKYSPAGGEILIKLTREADASGDSAVLAVRDRGTGIAREDLPHIFDWFFRGRNAQLRYGSGGIVGTGLGLAGSRQIVEQHGGTISVRSRLGAGSTFTVRLPLNAR